MIGTIAITDEAWYAFCAQHPEISEGSEHGHEHKCKRKKLHAAGGSIRRLAERIEDLAERFPEGDEVNQD